MSKVFGWKEQFSKGKKAEALFPQQYQGGQLMLPEEGVRAYDFERIDDGMRVELKGDQYDMEKTRNFFIERWSVVQEGKEPKPGSIWQSVSRADIFIYLFVKNGIYFEFEDIPAVIEAVELYVKENNVPLFDVQNKGYKGQGYRIPREALKHLYTEVKCRLLQPCSSLTTETSCGLETTT